MLYLENCQQLLSMHWSQTDLHLLLVLSVPQIWLTFKIAAIQTVRVSFKASFFFWEVNLLHHSTLQKLEEALSATVKTRNRRQCLMCSCKDINKWWWHEMHNYLAVLFVYKTGFQRILSVKFNRWISAFKDQLFSEFSVDFNYIQYLAKFVQYAVLIASFIHFIRLCFEKLLHSQFCLISSGYVAIWHNYKYKWSKSKCFCDFIYSFLFFPFFSPPPSWESIITTHCWRDLVCSCWNSLESRAGAKTLQVQLTKLFLLG